MHEIDVWPLDVVISDKFVIDGQQMPSWEPKAQHGDVGGII